MVYLIVSINKRKSSKNVFLHLEIFLSKMLLLISTKVQSLLDFSVLRHMAQIQGLYLTHLESSKGPILLSVCIFQFHCGGTTDGASMD